MVAGFASFLLIAGGILAVRLAQGPIQIDGLGPLIAEALADRFDHRYEFSVGSAALIKSPYVPTFGIDRLEVKEPSGHTILAAPRAEVSIDPFALVLGEVRPRRLEVFDIELRLALLPDGSLAMPVAARGEPPASLPVSAEGPADSPAALNMVEAEGPAAAAPRPAPAQEPRPPLATQMAHAIRAVVDMLTSASSPIAAIERVGISDGRLTVSDATSGRILRFAGVQAAFDKEGGATGFTLSVDGPNGRWSAAGLARGSPGEARSLTLSLQDLSQDEILIATGARSIAADFDIPLSGKLTLALTAEDTLAEASGRFEAGAGYLRFEDPDDEPMLIDKIEGAAHFDIDLGKLVIEPTRLTAGKTLISFMGSVTPPSPEGEDWAISLSAAEPNIAAPERPGQTEVRITSGALAARLSLAEKKLSIERFAISGPECGFAMAGTVDWTNGPRVRLGASLNPTPVGALLRLWPSMIAAPVRAWLLGHARDGIIESGSLRVDFDAPTLERMRAERAPPDDAMLLDFTVRGASVAFLPGVPPLQGFSGTGHVTGRTSSFKVTNGIIEAAEGRRLFVPQGEFSVANADLKPAPARITARVSADIATIEAMLSHEALKPFSRMPLDASTLKGQVDGSLALGLLLDPKARPEDTVLEIHTDVTGFNAERLIGNEGLEDASMRVDIDPAGFRAAGEGRMFGTLANVEVLQPAGQPAKATIRLTMDDSIRALHGFGDLPGLSGPVGVLIAAPLGVEKPRAEVEIDLAKAAIETAGISKPAGRPGRVSFLAILKDTGTQLDQIVFEAGAMEARGMAELGADSSLLLARFPVVKLAPGDQMKVDAVRAGDALKVMVRGSAIDARPFLKSLVFTPRDRPSEGQAGSLAPPGPVTGRPGAVREIDLDVRSSVMTGYGKRVVTGAELRFVKRGDEIRQFTVAGRFGRAPLSGNLTGGPAAPQLTLISEDAGSLLAFLDLYKHMEGGRLSVGMRVMPQSIGGTLVIDGFVLRDEPAMRRLVSEAVPPADSSGRRQRIDAGAIAFNKLQVRFQRTGSRLDLRDGTMHGEAIGLTVDGWVDYAYDRVDMAGTFVPAFAVNNLFSQIPVFGAILGGGANEGLFGVNYRLAGSAAAPTLSINPLSAIAPGILRQIFGVGESFAPAGAGR